MLFQILPEYFFLLFWVCENLKEFKNVSLDINYFLLGKDQLFHFGQRFKLISTIAIPVYFIPVGESFGISYHSLEEWTSLFWWSLIHSEKFTEIRTCSHNHFFFIYFLLYSLHTPYVYKYYKYLNYKVNK